MAETTTLSQRLQIALEQSGLKQRDIATICKLTPASVSDWFTGKTKSIRSNYVGKLADALNVSSVWLTTGEGDMKSPNVITSEDVCDRDDFVEIAEYEIRFAAGFGQEATLEELDSCNKAVYRRSWFIKRRINPNNCKRFRVVGDSMEPLLLDDDIVLVDCSRKTIVDGRIYAFVYGNSLKVKRLYLKLDGSLLVLSENPTFKEETIDVCEISSVQIIGEVIERSGSI